MTRKRTVDIDRFVAAIEANYRQWNPPIITFIANRGATPFEVLVSTLLSLRTKDEVTGVAAKRLLDVARTPQAMVELVPQEIERLIYPVGFYPTKAKRLLSISRILLDRYGGKGPDTLEELTARRGPQDRQSGARGGVQDPGHMCGHPRAPDQQPHRLRKDQKSGQDRTGSAKEAAQTALGALQ